MTVLSRGRGAWLPVHPPISPAPRAPGSLAASPRPCTSRPFLRPPGRFTGRENKPESKKGKTVVQGAARAGRVMERGGDLSGHLEFGSDLSALCGGRTGSVAATRALVRHLSDKSLQNSCTRCCTFARRGDAPHSRRRRTAIPRGHRLVLLVCCWESVAHGA